MSERRADVAAETAARRAALLRWALLERYNVTPRRQVRVLYTWKGLLRVMNRERDIARTPRPVPRQVASPAELAERVAILLGER